MILPMSVLPPTMIGMLTRKPKTTSTKLPCDAPAMASTLSTPIAASAMMIVFTAPMRLSDASTCSSFFSGTSNFTAIGKRIRPPMACRYGMVKSHTATSVMTRRMMTAPAVPMRIAFLRRFSGSLFAAIAMTTALSPPSSRSIRTIVPRAMRNCIDKISM